MSHKIKTFLSEVHEQNIISPSTIPNTMSFWHGGNLDQFNEVIAQKNGRYEYGPGLYLTTHYATAQKYARGQRKLYFVVVEKGVDLHDVKLDVESIDKFINYFVTGSKKKEVKRDIVDYEKEGGVPAYIFGNILLNAKAIKSTNIQSLRRFYIENGIDYEVVSNPFGWHEKMMVLYDMRKIVHKQVVRSKDKIEVFDLPTEWV